VGHAADQAADHLQVGGVGRNRRWRLAAQRGQGETPRACCEPRGFPSGIGRNCDGAGGAFGFELELFPLNRKLCKTAVGVNQLPVFDHRHRFRASVHCAGEHAQVERDLDRRTAQRLELE
jgi:hypothetical protein